MLEQVNTGLSVIVSAIALLGSVGSVSVLFYRVASLEKRHQTMKDEVEKKTATLTDDIRNQEIIIVEIKTVLAGIQSDLKWIRDAIARTARD